MRMTDGHSANTYFYLLLFCSKLANSGAFFHTEATRDMDLPQGHMQGQLSTTVTPEEDLTQCDLAARSSWGLGVGFCLRHCSVGEFCLSAIAGRDYSISRRPTVYSHDTCTKNTKITALFPRKTCVKAGRCAHCSLKYIWLCLWFLQLTSQSVCT